MKNLIIFTVFISILGIGCSPVYYKPNTQNVPLFTEKGDVLLSGIIEDSGISGQGALAVSDNIGVQFNIASFNSASTDTYGEGSIFEGGVGYYSRIGNRVIYEAYGLIGLGEVKNKNNKLSDYNNFSIGNVNATFTRFGLQQSVGLKLKYFEAAISSRFCRLDYGNISGNLKYREINQVDYLRNNATNYLFEPALTLRVGLEKIKLQMQVQSSYNLTNSAFFQDDTGLSIGLLVNLNHINRL